MKESYSCRWMAIILGGIVASIAGALVLGIGAAGVTLQNSPSAFAHARGTGPGVAIAVGLVTAAIVFGLGIAVTIRASRLVAKAEDED
jgi:hypothetical protein